jgi:4'-phosphopantetheinyl transferase
MIPASMPFQITTILDDQGLLTSSSTVDVWRVQPSTMLPLLSDFRSVLSQDELERADRFCFDRDRERFAIARGILRSILALYLKTPPAELRFSYNEFGKVSLSTQFCSARICFNLSHSVDMALVAVTYRREVGIDVEKVRQGVEVEQIARNFFSAREVEFLLEQTPIARPRAFFECWTRKEAYIKARGEGLSYPLDQFTISVGSDEFETLEVQNDPAESYRWRVCPLSLGSDYAGALVVLGHDWKLRMLELQLASGRMTVWQTGNIAAIEQPYPSLKN